MPEKEMRMAKRRMHKLDPLSIILIAVFGIVSIAAAITAFIVVRNLTKTWSMTSLPGAPQIAASEATKIAASGNPILFEPMQSSSGPLPEPWDRKSRVTVLLMGLDYRDWEAGEVPRTDSMMLLTLDPINDTAGILSIPRDLWVNIPGFDYAKINTAYFLGEINKLPGGGPALATETVEQFLGVPINYYAQIDFYAFARFIDSMGGLTLHVRDQITVDPLGPANTVTLYPGVQDLDGATTLAYARARYTEGGDFDRSMRQQEVLMAIRYQILAVNMLPTMIAKAPELYAEISSGLRTNMSLDEAIALGLAALNVPEKNIKQGVIGPPKQVIFATSPDGLSIMIPVNDQIRLLRDEIFASGEAVGPAAIGNDPTALMLGEQARVYVQNGTEAPGLATRTADYFRSLGMNVVGDSNADSIYQQSTLIIANGKPYTASYLQQLMGIQTANIYSRFEPDSAADIVVIVGNDWASSNTLP